MSDITVTLSGTRTLDFDCKNKNRLYILNNPIINGNYDSYEMDSNDLIGRGGESLVYKAKRISDGEIVAVKFYDQYVNSPVTNSNRRKILSLMKNSDYTQTHLMPIWDCGTYTITSPYGDEYNRPFDVIPYIAEGHIVKSDYKSLKNKIIPDITKAICFLHNNNIIHRDIKPSNIYIYNGFFVLADFGIATEKMSNDVVFTRQKNGSIGYSAPEVSQAYATTKSDWYSLGCTISTLYHGKHIYHTIVKSGNEGELYLAIKNNGFPLNCKNDEKDLQMLVDALTILDENERANHDDIMLFFNDFAKFKLKWERKRDKSDNEFEFTFENTVCKNIPQLLNTFVNNWETAIKYLYKGGANNSTVVRLFSTHNQSLAVKAIDIIEHNIKSVKNYDLGLAQFLHYLGTANGETACPVYWKGKVYNKLSEIAVEMKNNESVSDNIREMLESDFLVWKTQNTNIHNSKSIINKLKSVNRLFSIDKQVGYYYFMYMFYPDKIIEVTPDETFKELSKNRNFYSLFLNFNDNKKYLAYIAYLGYYDGVCKLLTNISPDITQNLELVYRFFEGLCNNKYVIRKHYAKFGPRSYLFYWKNNINKYTYLTDNANKLKSDIVKLKTDDTTSIDSIFKSSQPVHKYLNEFKLLFQNNMYLSNMGIREEKTIIAQSKDMFFDKKFFDTDVPAGFYNEITKWYEL